MNSKNFSSSRIIILAVSAAMIYFGIERGELSTIFAKATRVCLECIGLG
ncbi:MAG: thioredoxin [Selenomonadaceae bacterium]|nr:thioredoxin [Selenomonadaceae bacterium]